MGIEGLAENLFGAHQSVVIADGNHNVPPLQPHVAAGDVARRSMLDAADYKAGVTVRPQNLLYGAASDRGVNHLEVADTDLRTFRGRLHLRLPAATQDGE